jgi:hypothetical protein
MNTLFLGTLVLVLGFGLYVRLAPSDPARWHVAPDPALTADLATGQVKRLRGAAVAWLGGGGADALAALDRAAMGTPRTSRLAGSLEEGRITWLSRSRLWAFPDYITAELLPDGVVVHGRLRFGGDDLGVNAARLSRWIAASQR